MIGDNPFSLVAGCGAVWIRANEKAGKLVLKATHPLLGTRDVHVQIEAADNELV